MFHHPVSLEVFSCRLLLNVAETLPDLGIKAADGALLCCINARHSYNDQSGPRVAKCCKHFHRESGLRHRLWPLATSGHLNPTELVAPL